MTLDAAAHSAGAAVRDIGDASGDVLAAARRAVGDVEATLHRGAGWVEAGARSVVAELADRAAQPNILAPGLRDSLRNAAAHQRAGALGAVVDGESEARQARANAGAEAFAITTVASAGAAGALSGAAGVAALTAFRDETAVAAAVLAKQGAAESVERHGGATIIDSLEARDAVCRREMPEPAAPAVPAASRDRDDPAQPGHPGHALFRRIDDGVAAIDRSMGREPDDRSRNMAYAIYAEVHSQGWKDIGGVVLSQKAPKAEVGEYVFAHRGPPERAEDWVTLRTAEAVATPRDQSLDRVQQIELAQQREQAQRQTLDAARGPALA